MGFVKGIDVSNWTNVKLAQEHIENKENQFCMIKVSEGAGWSDVAAKTNAAMCRNNGVMIGFYHYCRPDKRNTPEAEMNNFIATVDDILSGCKISDRVMLILDWEGKSLGYEHWLKEATDILMYKYKVNPIVYTSEDNVYEVGEYVDTERVGLWFASWGVKPGEIGDISPWKVWAFHQYTNNPLDQNVFNGGVEQLRHYCQYPPIKEEDEPPRICKCPNCKCCPFVG